MSNIQTFKDNLFQGIWEHGKRLFKPLSTLILTLTIIGGIIFSLIIKYLLGSEIIDQIANLGQNIKNIDPESIAYIEQLITEKFSDIIVLVVLFFIVVYAIQSIVNAFILKTSEHSLKEEDTSFSSVLASVKKSAVVNIFIYSIVIAVLTEIVKWGSIKVFGSGGIDALISLVVGILVIRLIEVNAAIVHGEMKWIEAVKWSWKTITFKRAILIFLAFFASAIILGIVVFILALGLLSIGKIGGILLFIVLLVALILGICLLFAMQTALYYRYDDNIVDEQNINEHLILDDE